MDANAAYAEFRRMKSTLPFVPFELETTDGRKFFVERRMGFAATPKMVIVLDARDHSHWVKYPELKAVHAAAKAG
jgi:hypothetical protein